MPVTARPIHVIIPLVILAFAVPATAQPTLLDALVQKLVPHPLAPHSSAAHPAMPGTAWLREIPDVSGITLGMSPDAVTTAISGKPLALVATDRLPPRAERIKAAVDQRLGTVAAGPTRRPQPNDDVARMKFVSADRQTLVVTFGDGPVGRVVTAVSYHIDATTITRDRFSSQVEARYGPIPIEFDSSSYCTASDPKCGWTGQANTLPGLTVDWAINAYTLTLTEGSQTKAQRLAPFEAEITRQAPKTANEVRTTSF